MTDRLNSPTQTDDAPMVRDPRNTMERAAGFTPLSARGFSAIMHREAGLRAPARPPPRADIDIGDSPFGALELSQNLRRAVAALLRGDHVRPDERLALGRAVSLHAEQDRLAASMAQAFARPANSNCAAVPAPPQSVVPPSPSPLCPDTENPVLRDLLRRPGYSEDA
jgi:hypothetical protein